ncbi:MAG: PAS domain S-box protein [Ardenticatenaceae bacterium]|nr:PAS domain S-box protein [Ardenticatenaceae bacterium]
MGLKRHILQTNTLANSEIVEPHTIFYQSLMHNSTLGFWMVADDGRLLQVNDAYLRRSGYTREELLSLPVSALEAPQVQKHTAVHHQIIKKQGNHEFETLHRTKDGKFWPVEVNATYADGYYFAIIQDITQRKKTESELRQKSSALENSLNGFNIVSADGKFLYANQAYLRMWGYDSLDEIIGTSPSGHCANPDIATQIIQNLEAHNEYTLQFTALCKDGSTFQAIMAAQKMVDNEGIVTYVGTSIDITPLLQTQEILDTERARLRNLLDAIPDLVWLKDPDGNYLACNPTFERLVGLPEAEVIGKNDYDFFESAAADEFRRQDRKAMQTGAPTVNEEQATFVADGRTIFTETIKTSIVDENGKTLGVLGIARDITERKNMEEALRQSQARISGIFDSAMDAIVSIDENHKIVFFNAAAERMFGYTAEEIIGQNQNLLIPTRFREMHAEHVRWFSQISEMRRPMESLDSLVGLRANGEEFPIEISISSVTVDEKVYSTAIMRDITQRKQAEQSLQESEERLELALKGADLGLWDWKIATGHVIFNERWAEMLGYSLDELAPHVSTWESLIHPEDKPATWETLKAHLDGRTNSYETIHRMRTKAGNWKWILDRGRVLQRDETGKPLRAVGTHLDITDRKLAEEALLESEEKLQIFIEHAPAALAMFDQQMRYLAFSHRWLTDYGLEGQDIINRSHYETFPEISDRWKTIHQRALSGEVIRAEEDPFVRLDGHTQWLRWEVRPWYIANNEIGGIVIFSEDITERKHAEEKIEELQQILAQAETIAKIGSWKWDLVSQVLTWSAEMYNLFGVDQANNDLSLRQIIYERIHPDDLETVRQSNASVLESHKPTPIEYRLVLPDGTMRTVWAEARLVRDESGQPAALVGYAQDVSEHRKAEATIARLNQRMELILNSAGEGIYGTDVNGRITFINPAMANMLGWKANELLGKNAHVIFHHTRADGTPYPVSECQIITAIQNGVERLNQNDLFWHKDGTPIFVDYTSTPIHQAGKVVGSVTMVRNVTQHKKAAEEQAILEEQLRQAQKMESIGRLAGGVAHDFNNQLAVITLYGDLMRQSMSKQDPLLPKLEQIRQAADRASDLTRQMLAFSRKQVLQPVLLNMNVLVTNLEKMLGRLIGEDVVLSTSLQPDLWSVMADPGQMEQVIMNLTINARDAMPTGGMVTIETHNILPSERASYLHQDMPDCPCILLALTDTGYGMDEETMKQIFEPFFTTKQAGQGTGLGLATVHGIVKQSGGTIYVYSEPNQGTTFKIYLPAIREQSKQITVSTGPLAAEKGSEIILLVEDEPALRDLIEATLTEIGYTVVAAQTGEEALALAQTYPDPIHLLLTDVVLPQMNGREIAEALTAVHPQINVLFISGYMDDAIMRHGVLTADTNFLSKPFARSTLAAKVREVLDNPT